jgi:beta-glucosidase/6-phospho-beta-glucosidase/beta-galactosidase
MTAIHRVATPELRSSSVTSDPCRESVSAALFEGIFLGGFECSCHRLADGRRLDLHASTRHDTFAAEDFTRLREVGMTACRDGISWVKSELNFGAYDFGHAAPLVQAARAHGVQAIWDLMHFGWPDDVDPFAPSFPARFGRYARAFARWYADQSDQVPMIAPINEMSFLAWAGGDVRCLNPFEAARGVELKVQLVLATIEAIEAIRSVLPRARFLQPEPVIHIVPAADQPKTWRRVESDELLQYQAWDMLLGRVWPRLGGGPQYLDVIGVNFYSDNQFMLDGSTVRRGDPRYKALSQLLLEVWARYRRPMIVSETGSEGDARAEWLRYVSDECVRALQQGCALHGITLYPVVDHPGWVDGRDCQNGLWGYADDRGARAVHAPTLRVLLEQTPRLTAARAAMLRRVRQPEVAG